VLESEIENNKIFFRGSLLIIVFIFI